MIEGRFNLDFGIDHLAAVPHDTQPKPAGFVRMVFKSEAIVTNGKAAATTDQPETDLDAAGPGMFDGIVERLLGDAV